MRMAPLLWIVHMLNKTLDNVIQLSVPLWQT